MDNLFKLEELLNEIQSINQEFTEDKAITWVLLKKTYEAEMDLELNVYVDNKIESLRRKENMINNYNVNYMLKNKLIVEFG